MLFLTNRLSSSDFKSGFILQTLNNIFFESDVSTLIVLLNIVGYVEYILFVTFLNSMDNYIRKIEELRELKGRLQYISLNYKNYSIHILII